EWSRIPHFYNDFYVYKYATGLISAQIIATNIFEGKSFATENYIKFLSGGNSLPPVELLKIAGVHLDEEKDFDNAYHKIEEILDEWEKLLEKKKVE
ncbi:MAG: M3 family metallopeptidase, partial [Clostridia bacterium]